MYGFEPAKNTFTKYYRGDKLWREDRYIDFVKTFDVKSVNHFANIANAPYIARFLETVGKMARRHKNDVYDNFNYWELFDHVTAFRTFSGIHFIIAMPYGTPESILSEYHKLCEDYDCMKSVKMYFVDNKYKYRKNGNYMLLFTCFPDEIKACSTDAVSEKNAPEQDTWSEE